MTAGSETANSPADPGSASGGTLGRLGGVLGRGAGLSAAALCVVQCVTLIQTLVLARLLSPETVGIFAAGTVLSTFLVVLTHGTLAQALIQREHDVDDATTTAFWVTLGTGACCALGILALSPVIGAIFESPEIARVTAVMSGSVLLTASTSVPDALMQRRFQFSRRLVIDPAVAIGFAVCASVLAALGFGVWSLVVGTYVSLLIWVVASWGLARCSPFRGRLSVRLWRDMAYFSFPLLLDGITYRLQEMAELTLIGRALGEDALGNYRYGRRIALVPAMAVVQICSFVLFPAFARIAGDPDRLRSAFLRALRWIWLAVTPVSVLMIAVGEPLVVLLFGERWRGAGMAVMAMSGVGLGTALNSVTSESLKGTGRSQRMNWMTGVGILTGVPLLLVLLPAGLPGVGLAASGTALVVGATGLVVTRSVVDVGIGDLARTLAPPVIAALLAAAVIWPLEHLVVESDLRSLPEGLGTIALECVGFMLVYFGVLRVVAPRSVTEIVTVLRRLSHLGAARVAGT